MIADGAGYGVQAEYKLVPQSRPTACKTATAKATGPMKALYTVNRKNTPKCFRHIFYTKPDRF